MTIVFELGSSTCKVGFAGNANPDIIFPTIVAIPKDYIFRQAFVNPLDIKVGGQVYTGNNEADKILVHYAIHRPYENGIISTKKYQCFVNGKIVEKTLIHHIFEYGFKNINVNPNEVYKYSVVIPDCPSVDENDTWENRFNLAKILFEDFKVPYLYIGNQGRLALLSIDLDTGIVLDCGDYKTSVTPIFQGLPIDNSTMRYQLAGNNITTYLQKKLVHEKRITDLDTPKKLRYIDSLKIKNCYISMNYQMEQRKIPEKQLELMDGSQTSLQIEQIEGPELLFNPRNEETYVTEGIHKMIINCIQNSIVEIQKLLAENIYVIGGTSKFKNFVERTQLEMNNYLKENSKEKYNFQHFQIRAIPDPEFASWRGGSKIGILDDFHNFAIKRDDYMNSKDKSLIIYDKSF